MSNEQLVTAYLNGALGRRQLVRRLVAGGVTLSAALVYAGVAPAAASAEPGRGKGSFGTGSAKATENSCGVANWRSEFCGF